MLSVAEMKRLPADCHRGVFDGVYDMVTTNQRPVQEVFNRLFGRL
jgi:hypothetical protein